MKNLVNQYNKISRVDLGYRPSRHLDVERIKRELITNVKERQESRV